MSKIYNSTIKYNLILTLIILVIFATATVAFLPKEVSAEGGRNIHFGPNTKNDSSPRIDSESASNGINYSSNTGSGIPSTTYVYTAPKSTTTTTTAKKTTTTTAAKTSDDSLNGLAASALFGDDSFLPSGLTQWLLLLILILFLIILVRKTFGAERAYHATPLKHH
ncbi:hypothetical protein K8Q98_03000 [Candidatus Nomurabacteria bacterium]|nr:hypothetical protein [Candidatus Nomurabacteria bacterium]